MKLSFLVPLFLCAVFFVDASQTKAVQPRAPAGIVERQIQEEYETKPISPDKDLPYIEIDVPEDQLDFPDDETVFVKEIVFQGNCFIKSKQLEELARCYLHSEMSMKDIGALCSEVEKYYVKKGYFLARAYPPPQEIERGVLTIQILEGCLGSISVCGNRFYSSAFVESYFRDMVGSAIQYDLFLKRVLLLNDNTNLRAGVVFKKGENVGTVDLIVRVIDKRPLQFYVDYNNYGSSFTTRSRTGAKGHYGNLLMYGDNVYLTQVFGFPFDDLSFTQAVYRVPVFKRAGTQVEGSYLYSRFHVPPLDQLEVRGATNIATLRVLQAMMRTRIVNLDGAVSFDFKDIRNYALDQAASIDILRVLGMSITGDCTDELGGSKARTFFDSTLYVGIPDLFGGSPAVNPRSSHLGAGAQYLKWNLGLRRIQGFKEKAFLMFNIQGQLASRKLPIAEEIYIGGVDTVRGFLPAVALGDKGLFANAELRIAPPILGNYHFFKTKKKWKDVLQLVSFIDCGTVYFLGNTGVTQTTLTGAGVGARFFGPLNFDASIDVGFPIQSDITPTSTVTYIRINWHAF